MAVKFLGPAQAELAEATAYYHLRDQNPGTQFVQEVKRNVGRILQFPEAWSPLLMRTRRCLTNKFPYGIVDQVRGEALLIVAVMHLHRKPAAWKRRIRGGEE